MSEESKALPDDLSVRLQVFMDAVSFGAPDVQRLMLKAGSNHAFQVPAGGQQPNSARLVRLRLENLQPFVDGWWTGIASLEIDMYHVGHWRQFMFNINNSDAPSVVHFAPTAFVPYGPGDLDPVTNEQHIFSFSIAPFATRMEGEPS
jgi:hypothetical protein